MLEWPPTSLDRKDEREMRTTGARNHAEANATQKDLHARGSRDMRLPNFIPWVAGCRVLGILFRGPTMNGTLLFLASFFASAVEMVEALTIVLAVGLTRGWRASLAGAVSALAALGAMVALFGADLVRYVPLGYLRLVVGVFLLAFGLQWLRKAILRAVGSKAHRDEELVFRQEVEQLGGLPADQRAIDPGAFVVSFKGVFLEGIEVVFVVLAFGAGSGRVGLSSAGALLALVLVGLAGLVVRGPLGRVPENTIKLAVGVVLAAFGTFWTLEGLGYAWPLGEGAIPLLVLAYGLCAAILIWALRRLIAPPGTPY